MTSMERNLKHWFLYQAKTGGITFLMILGFSVIYSFASGGSFSKEFATILPLYLGLMAVFSIIVNGFTGISVIFPVTVSFGANRKHSVIAMAISIHTLAVIEFGITFAAIFYSKPEIGAIIAAVWPLVIGGVALILALGNIVALLSNKFGRLAGVICYGIIILFSVVGICCGINLVGEKLMTPIISTMVLAISTVIALAFIGLDVLSIHWLYKSVKNKDLSFVS